MKSKMSKIKVTKAKLQLKLLSTFRAVGVSMRFARARPVERRGRSRGENPGAPHEPQKRSLEDLVLKNLRKKVCQQKIQRFES